MNSVENTKLSFCNLTEGYIRAKETATQLHIKFLDGLRGLAALYVVFFHVIAKGNEDLSTEEFYINFFQFGHEAVVVFIILSGFVLALPIARSPERVMNGGISGFLKKRARRILPAYYAALFLIPGFILLIELIKYLTGEGADWGRIQHLFLSPDMLSHLFMLHNLSDAWAYSADLNMVLWSMATEWWSYVIFALILVPIWRGFGILIALITGFTLGMIPVLFDLLNLPSISGHPYLLGAFSLGMTSASFVIDNNKAIISARYKILKLGALLAFTFFCGIVIIMPSIRLNSETRWITDMLLAIVCTILIWVCASETLNQIPPRKMITGARKILESPILVWLGSFSYSLYLTHLAVMYIIGTTLNLKPIKNLIVFSFEPMSVRVFVLIPLILGIAYGFYLIFERPFLNTKIL